MGWTTTHSIEVAAPPSTLWRLSVAVGDWPDWNERVERAHLDGPLRVGARGLLTLRSGPKSPFVVTAIDEGASFETVTHLPGARIRLRFRIEGSEGISGTDGTEGAAGTEGEAGDGDGDGVSVISAATSLTGPMAFAYRRFLNPGLTAGVALSLARLATVASAPVASAPDDPADA